MRSGGSRSCSWVAVPSLCTLVLAAHPICCSIAPVTDEKKNQRPVRIALVNPPPCNWDEPENDLPRFTRLSLACLAAWLRQLEDHVGRTAPVAIAGRAL